MEVTAPISRRPMSPRATSPLLPSLFMAACLALAGCDSPSGGGGPGWSVDPDAATCQPSCHFKQCGDNGCGGTCGFCMPGLECKSFQCVAPGEEPDVIIPPADAGGSDAGAQPELPVSGSDGDGDGVPDSIDNCQFIYNPTQADMDGDKLGDACDPDIDGDGYFNEFDCAPTNKKVHPGAKELCGNGIDDNCNGDTDEEDAWDCTPYYIDADNDGAGASSTRRCLCAPDVQHKVKVAGDCNDNDPSLSPLLPEKCDDIDNNCNMLVDEGCDDDGDGFCDATMVVVGTPAVCPNGGGDCYDYSPAVYPGAPEIEADGIDNNCDGTKAGEPTGGGPIVPDCTGMPCTGTSSQAFLCALEICYPDLLISAAASSPIGSSISSAWTAMSHYGSATNDLTPFAGPSYGVMASGNVSATGDSHQDQLGGSGFDKFEAGSSIHDSVEFKVTLKAPPGATGFSIDYIFMSAEYHEWVGSSYNDKFYMILKAPQTTGGVEKVINFTDCSNPNSYWDIIQNGKKYCYIAINSAFSEPCPVAPTNISGTGHECSSGGSSTGWLQTSWPIKENEVFELTFHIHDTADMAYDSTVVIDNFRWEGGTFQQGTSASHN